MRKIDLNKSPESHCPRYDDCNINKCPLRYDFEKLQNDESDTAIKNKEKCTDKNIRIEIATAFKLKNLGLTQKEFSNRKKSFEMRGCIFPPKNEISCQVKGENEQNHLIQAQNNTTSGVINE